MKRIARAIGIATVLLGLLAFGLSFFLNANQFRPMLERELTRSLGREVKVGDLKLALLSGGVTASDLSIADDPGYGKTPFLRAESLHVGVEIVPLLLSRQLNVTALTLEKPEIILIQAPSGEWNFSTLGQRSAATSSTTKDPQAQKLDLSVKLIKVSDGRLSISHPARGSKPEVFNDVNAEVKDFSSASVFPYSLRLKFAGDGVAKLEGKAGPINSADTSLTPVEASLDITHLDLIASGLADRSSGFAGILAIKATGSSNGRKLQGKGQIKADHWKVASNGTPAPKPLEFDFALQHDVLKRTGVLSQGSVHIGKVAAALSGTYAQRQDSPILNMKFAGTNIPIPELEAMLPALGVVLPAGSSLQGGTATAHFTIEGPADRMVTTGSVSLNRTRLTGFDLGGKLKAVAVLTGIPAGPDTDIQTFSADVRRSPAGTSADAINLIVPTIGELTGAGVVSPAHALDFKMRAKLHTSGSVMAALGQNGDTTIPFFIRGTAEGPSFVPDVKDIAKEKVNTLLRNENTQKAVKGLLDNFLGRKKQE